MQRLHFVAAAILLFGVIASALIYAVTGNDTDGDQPILNQSRYEFDLERVGGKLSVYLARLDHWLATLWHGRPLAYTVLALALLAALACLAVARIESSPMQGDTEVDKDPRHPMLP